MEQSSVNGFDSQRNYLLEGLIQAQNPFFRLEWTVWSSMALWSIYFLWQYWYTVSVWVLGRCSTTWAPPPALFCVGYFWERVSPSICLGWPQTAILLISASWVVRITGWHPALWSIFIFPFMVLFGVYLDYDKLGDRLISLGHQLLGRHTIYQYKHTDIKVY
jgi:hypothetical protein